MNHIMQQLKTIMMRDLQRHEGVVVAMGNGKVKVATRRGQKTFDTGSISYKSGEKVTYDDTLGVVGRKRSPVSSKLIKV